MLKKIELINKVKDVLLTIDSLKIQLSELERTFFDADCDAKFYTFAADKTGTEINSGLKQYYKWIEDSFLNISFTNIELDAIRDDLNQIAGIKKLPEKK